MHKGLQWMLFVRTVQYGPLRIVVNTLAMCKGVWRPLVNISKPLIHLQDLVNWVRYCCICSKLGLIGDDFNKYEIFLAIIADLDC